jgi:hypothetical protein
MRMVIPHAMRKAPTVAKSQKMSNKNTKYILTPTRISIYK